MSIRPEVRAAAVEVTDLIESRTGVRLDTYGVLAVYDVLARRFPEPPRVVAGQLEFDHDTLVGRVLTSHSIIEALRDNKKIAAINELRTITGCGLKRGKEAIEDERVTTHVQQVIDAEKGRREDYERAVRYWCCEVDSGPYPKPEHYGLPPEPEDPLADWEKELQQGPWADDRDPDEPPF
jgi:hypothetical protein